MNPTTALCSKIITSTTDLNTAASREGLVHGPAVYFSESGATEERTYADGVCQGPATLRMPNGDTEERMYEGGALHGIATFFSHMGDR